ncbi:MAG TPA: hypothetical protein VKW06_15055 [Candidatus Angelobacter sp.]|nr:hypothetical protein [Candidatus Angelobacter sp.]
MATAALPVQAQANGGNRAQANLRIQVNVVAVAATPSRPYQRAANDDIVFNVSADGLKMSVVEETRELTPRESMALQPAITGPAILQTRTVVLP